MIEGLGESKSSQVVLGLRRVGRNITAISHLSPLAGLRLIVAIIATLAKAEVSAGAVAEIDQNVKSSRIGQN